MAGGSRPHSRSLVQQVHSLGKAPAALGQVSSCPTWPSGPVVTLWVILDELLRLESLSFQALSPGVIPVGEREGTWSWAGLSLPGPSLPPGWWVTSASVTQTF